MARRLAPRFAALLLLLASVRPLAAGRPPIQTLDLARGLAGDVVWDLELDDAGALWIATSTGVSRFDGVRFRNFDARHGLPHTNVLRLLRLADGRIAAGTGVGVALLDPLAALGEHPWRALPSELPRGGGQLIELVEDRRGTLWAGGLRGLFRVEGEPGDERLVQLPLPASEPGVRLLADDRGEGLWVGLEQGLYHRAADGTWSDPQPLPAELADVAGLTGLLVDRTGVLWIASRSALCGILPGDPRLSAGGALPREVPRRRFTELRPPSLPGSGVCVDLAGGLPGARSRRVIEAASDGRLLATGSGGVVEISAAGLVLRLSSAAAGEASLQTALAAPDGTLWVGTSGRGLLRLLRSGIELVGGAEGLSGAVSTLLLRDSTVELVLDYFEPKRRVLGLEGDRWVERTPPDAAELAPSWGWGAISTLAPDLSWWAGRSGGVTRFPRRADGRLGAALAPPAALARALAGEQPIRLFWGGDGALWVASHQPVALHRADLATGEVTSFPELADFPGGAPSAFVEGGDATAWVGFFGGGLARRRNGGAFEWQGDAAAAVRGFVYTLRYDAAGRLWVAAGGGLALCHTPGDPAPRCERALPGTELDHLQVFGVLEDRLGRILAGTAKGLYVVDPASGRLDVLTSAEGLPGNNVSALEPAPDGSVWIATDRGLARFAPLPPAGEPAPVRIVELTLAGRARPVPLAGSARIGELTLGPGERSVELEVASVHLGAGAPPAYQWRIGSADWSPPSTERRLRLAGLAPGALAVEARAVSAAGEVGKETARLELRVLPPLWRRSWFVGGVAALLAGALGIVYRLRVARLVALERVRTRIAADLHDDLGSSLSRISILSEVARRQIAGPAEASSTLETIGASARELAEMASDIVWAIDPQRDDLASWVARLRRFGEDLFDPQGVAFAVIAPPDAAAIRLSAAARRDLFLLAKEALNNAAKYAGARRVEVSTARRGGRLEVRIEDDGSGIASDADQRAAARGGGHGLRTMRERAARLGGELALDRPPGGGTRISLSFPL